MNVMVRLAGVDGPALASLISAIDDLGFKSDVALAQSPGGDGWSPETWVVLDCLTIVGSKERDR